MSNAFVTWARAYIARIEMRLPWLDSHQMIVAETRDGLSVNAAEDLVRELVRQRDDLLALVSAHEARGI